MSFGEHISGMSNDYNEVSIIGGSLSGVVAAFLLGKAGKRVSLIDPQQFPRKKACGEGLSSLGVSYLKSMGLWEGEISNHAYPFYGYTLQFSSRKSPIELTRSPLEQPQGYGISRIVLDTTVHDRVRELPNVTLMNDAVHQVSFEGSRAYIETQKCGKLSSDHLIIACGARSVSKLFPGLSVRDHAGPRFGMAFWCEGAWRESPPDTVQIFNRTEGQYIITPLGESSVNMSLLLEKNKTCSLKKEEVIRRAREILQEAGFITTVESETLAASEIHSARLQHGNSRAYFIGDAIERFDPISGMGMAHALYSASRAVSAISHGEPPSHYINEREVGASVIRKLTSMSYALNVKQDWMLYQLIRRAPQMAFQVMDMLKGKFPKPQHHDFIELEKVRSCTKAYFSSPTYEERV